MVPFNVVIQFIFWRKLFITNIARKNNISSVNWSCMVTQFTFSYKGGVISEIIFNFRGPIFKNVNQITVHQLFNLEIVNQNLRLTNGHFTTISSQFSAIYMNIFHKTEVQMVILRCWTGLNLNYLNFMTQNANGAVTNRRENTQLFSEGSLIVTKKRYTNLLTLSV